MEAVKHSPVRRIRSPEVRSRSSRARPGLPTRQRRRGRSSLRERPGTHTGRLWSGLLVPRLPQQVMPGAMRLLPSDFMRCLTAKYLALKAAAVCLVQPGTQVHKSSWGCSADIGFMGDMCICQKREEAYGEGLVVYHALNCCRKSGRSDRASQAKGSAAGDTGAGCWLLHIAHARQEASFVL